LKYIGKLLCLHKNFIGVITPSDVTAINVEVSKGFYLVTDYFIDESSNNIFMDILVQDKIVLLRLKSYNSIEFLN
jgi:hypothetical protein